MPKPKVSDTITAPTGILGEPVRRGIEAIDAVHSADRLPTIGFKRAVLPIGEQGHYDPTPPYELIVAIGARWPAFTTAHEIGHVLDHHGFGAGAAFVTRTDPRFADWRAALAASQALADFATIQVMATTYPLPELAKHIAYLTEYVELWARS